MNSILLWLWRKFTVFIEGALDPEWRERAEAAEKRAVIEALEKCAGNQTKAADLLGVSRRTLVTRLQQYGMTRSRKK